MVISEETIWTSLMVLLARSQEFRCITIGHFRLGLFTPHTYSCNVGGMCMCAIIILLLYTNLGLKLRQKGKTAILKCFPYALFLTTQESFIPVDWQDFITQEEEGTENIRLHELIEEDQLTDILEDFEKGNTQAAVLINMTDTYELAEKFVSSVKEAPFTTVVVQRMDGVEIMKYLTHNEDIQACVVAESRMDGSQPPAVNEELEHDVEGTQGGNPPTQARTGKP